MQYDMTEKKSTEEVLSKTEKLSMIGELSERMFVKGNIIAGDFDSTNNEFSLQ